MTNEGGPQRLLDADLQELVNYHYLEGHEDTVLALEELLEARGHLREKYAAEDVFTDAGPPLEADHPLFDRMETASFCLEAYARSLPRKEASRA